MTIENDIISNDKYLYEDLYYNNLYYIYKNNICYFSGYPKKNEICIVSGKI